MDEITRELLAACKAALPFFISPKSMVGHQLRAVIAMAEQPHTPRRPMAERIEREAAAQRIDAEMLADKKRDGYAKRGDSRALELQQQYQAGTGVTL